MDRLADRLIDGDVTVQRRYGQLLEKASSDETPPSVTPPGKPRSSWSATAVWGLKSELRRVQEVPGVSAARRRQPP